MKGKNFWVLLKVVGANRKNKTNFGFGEQAGEIRRNVQSQQAQELILTLLTDRHGWVPAPVTLALGRGVASQGEASVAPKGDRVPVGVAELGDSHPPIRDLWGWAHHP